MPVSVFPEQMGRLDLDDARGSLWTVESYIRYMTERIEFSLSNNLRSILGLGSMTGTLGDLEERLKQASWVTPEDFGAKGDGDTDDTAAIQAAFDAGYSVRFARKTYRLTGQVTCGRDVTVDFNYASFVRDGNNLPEGYAGAMFLFSGEEVAEPFDAPDYGRGQTNYQLTGDYAGYTGMAMLKGTNHMDTRRQQYKAGFIAAFYKGGIVTPYPIPVTGVKVTPVRPVRVTLKNAGDFVYEWTPPEPGEGEDPALLPNKVAAIEIRHGLGCRAEGFDSACANCYEVLRLSQCLNTAVEGCMIRQDTLNAEDKNSYLVSVADTCYTTIRACVMHNAKWHCVTTGKNYLCYSTLIDHCDLSSGVQPAVGDHPNGMLTQVVDSAVTSCVLSYMGTVRRSVIYAKKTDMVAVITLDCGSDEANSIFSITDTVFEPPSEADERSGVTIKTYSGQDGPEGQGVARTYYATLVELRSVRSAGGGIYLLHDTDDGAQAHYHGVQTGSLGTLIVEDCDLALYGLKESNREFLNATNAKITVIGQEKAIGRATGNKYSLYGNVTLVRSSPPLCRIVADQIIEVVGDEIRVILRDLTVTDSTLPLGAAGSSVTVSGTLRGSGVTVDSWSAFETLTDNAARTVVTDVLDGEGTAHFNIDKVKQEGDVGDG